MRLSLVRAERRSALFWILLAFAVVISGAGASAQDLDGDGVDDSADNCINTPNPDQLDPGGDGYGIACDCDFDGSHFTNASDFTFFMNQFQLPLGSVLLDPDYDLDSSGVISAHDFQLFLSCFGAAPGPSGPLCASQGLGCPSDTDFDLDGVDNTSDNCVEAANPQQQDTDGDGFGNLCDGDFDGDGFTSSADVTYFGCGVADPASFPETDLNSDGAVVASDYLILDALLDLPPVRRVSPTRSSTPESARCSTRTSTAFPTTWTTAAAFRTPPRRIPISTRSGSPATPTTTATAP